MDDKSPDSGQPSGPEEEQPPSKPQEYFGTHANGLEPSPPSTPPVAASETVPGATLSTSSPTPVEPGLNGDENSIPGTRHRLRRRSEVPSLVESDSVAAAMEPLTDEERQNWLGWVELESDPVSLT